MFSAGTARLIKLRLSYSWVPRMQKRWTVSLGFLFCFMELTSSMFAFFECFKSGRRLEIQKRRFCWLSENPLPGGWPFLHLISIVIIQLFWLGNIIIIWQFLICSHVITSSPTPRSGLPGRLDVQKRRFSNCLGRGCLGIQKRWCSTSWI